MLPIHIDGEYDLKRFLVCLAILILVFRPLVSGLAEELSPKAQAVSPAPFVPETEGAGTFDRHLASDSTAVYTYGEDKESGPVVRIIRRQGRTSLIVPKSFEGRTGTIDFSETGVQIFDRVEFTREKGNTKLSGTVNRFAFTSEIDRLRAKVWESRKGFPKRTICSECHGKDMSQARTQVWLGEETRRLTPEIFHRGLASIEFPDADATKSYFELRHWITPHQAIHAGSSAGHLRSFNKNYGATSSWLGWTWANRKNLNLLSELRSSKTQEYPNKREFIGKLAWEGKKGFALDVQGGILLDGFGQYDVGFSDVGNLLISTEKANSEFLPTIYTKLKNDRFGYYTFQVRYEYAF